MMRSTNGDPALPPSPDPGIDWLRVLSALKSRRGFILLVLLLGSGLGFLGSRLVPQSYLVEARLWIEAPPRLNGAQGPIQSSQLFETNAWEELLHSYRVLEDVVRAQRLYLGIASRDAAPALEAFGVAEHVVPGDYVLQTDSSGTRYRLATAKGDRVDAGSVGDSVGASVGFRWQPTALQLGADRSVAFSVRPVRDAAHDLGEALQSQMDAEGNFLRVTLRGPDPRRAAATLNAVIERFVEVAGELKRATLSERTRILAEQLDSARQSMVSADRALELFRVRNITQPGRPTATSAADGADGILDDYFELRAQRDGLRRARETLERALAVGQAGSFPVEMLEDIPEIQQATEMRLLLQEVADKRAELRDLRYRFTDESTSVQQLLQDLEHLEREILPAHARGFDAELERRAQALDERIDALGRSLAGIPPRVLEEAQLTRNLTLAQDLHGALEKRYEEARLAEVSSIPDVRILDMAAAPQQPESQQARRILILALLASLGAAVAGALVLDGLDPHVRYPVQVTRGLGLNILGGIPRLRRGHGRAARESRAQIAESFRALRLSLAHAYGSAGPIVFTVTSPEQGDGKSFVASNLAQAFSRQGRRTIVVDGDLRRGRLHTLLGTARSPGLGEYLEGQVSADGIVASGAAGKPDAIPAGAIRSESGEILSSRPLGQLLGLLKARYDVVIIDTPPLRAGVDALILSALTGNLLFVLRTGATDRALAESKLELLDQLPVRVLGAALNDIRGQEGLYRHYAYDAYYRLTEVEALPPPSPRLPGPPAGASV